MRHNIILTILIGLIFLIFGCCKDPKPGECGEGRQWIIGGCWNEPREFYFFSGFPDFYCYNDSIAVGIPVDEIVSPIIYLSSYQYLENQGSKDNWLTGGSRSNRGRGEELDFYETCWNAPGRKISYFTFLTILDYKNVGVGTKELHCKLELRADLYDDQDAPIYPPKTVLDSSTIILKRVN